jgi:hypothetical protein
MSYSYEKAVQPLVAKVYLAKSEGELIQNFEELKALLTSMLESEEIETGTIITSFHALLEITKNQSVAIARMKSQIEQVEKAP